jgi:hypothetical protein
LGFFVVVVVVVIVFGFSTGDETQGLATQALYY